MFTTFRTNSASANGRIEHPALLRYAVTLAITLTAFAAKAVLNSAFGFENQFLLYVLAVIVSVWYGGFRCGLTATALSLVLVHFDTYLVAILQRQIPGLALPISPQLSSPISQAIRSAVFALIGITISTIIQSLQKVKAVAIQNERRYRDLAETMPQIVWMADVEGSFTYTNQQWQEFFGDPEKLQNTSGLDQFVHPDDAATFKKLWQEAVSRQHAFTQEHQLRNIHTDLYRWHLTRIVPIYGANHEVQKWIGTSTDIHEQKRAETSQRFLLKASKILSSSLDYQATLTSVARLAVPYLADWCTIDILEESDLFEQIAVVHRDTDKTQLVAELQDSGFSLSTIDNLGDPASAIGASHLNPHIREDWLRTRVKKSKHLKLLREVGICSYMIVPLVAQNKIIGTISLVSSEPTRQFDEADLSVAEELAQRAALAVDNARLYRMVQEELHERKLAEEQMTHQAYHDILTGLPNRSLMNDRLDMAIKEAKRNETILALIFVDIDHFKNINDTLGHQVGDRFLQEISQRLQTCVREEDTVARFGGDEFLILLHDIKHSNDAERVAKKILDALENPFIHEDQEIAIQASMGIALYPQDGLDINTLLRNADSALYRSKKNGRNMYQLYNQSLGNTSVVRFNIENRLIKGFNQKEFAIEFQPVFTPDRKIQSAEALLRWYHPQLGSISPIDFIPIAEETGFIITLEEWVLQQVCDLMVGWRMAGLPILPIAVNISLRHLSHPDFLESIKRIVESNKINPENIKLEITESAVMQQMEDNIVKLQELKDYGFTIALDDFGTGYSSLNHLKRFPIDYLKIDRSFIRHCTEDPLDAAIVEAIIAMAHTLSLKVIAEGIERDDQLLYLSSIDCDLIQGFLLSLPLAKDRFIEVSRTNPVLH